MPLRLCAVRTWLNVVMGVSNMNARMGLRGSQRACVVIATQQHHANLGLAAVEKTRSSGWSGWTHQLLARALKLKRPVVGWQGWR